MNRAEKRKRNISPAFKPNEADALILDYVTRYEGTPFAIKEFAKSCRHLTDYGYWFGLSTLWVSYTGFSDLNLWRQLFQSERPDRDRCIMKPDELKAFRALPNPIVAHRAHRENETDWLSFTTSMERANKFLGARPGGYIKTYSIPKEHALCYFLRRGEFEILVLDKSKAVRT